MSRFLLLLSLLLLLLLSTGGDADSDSDSLDSEKPNLRARPLILVKVWCLILVFVGTFVGGISPYFMKWNKDFLVLGTHFAGVVLLGTVMMPLLIDSIETFGDLTSKPYPFAFMLSCAGHLITRLADSVISYVYGKQRNGSSSGDLVLQGNGKANSNGRASVSQNEVHNDMDKVPIATATSLGDSILLIVALCFPSVFEGIAIGVAETEADAWKALWTVSLHMIFSTIAMGIALLRMIPDRPLFSCAAYAFAFAISSLIGVAIGIVINATTQGKGADWIYAISMCLACGKHYFSCLYGNLWLLN